MPTPNNFGTQVRDAVQSAVTTKDYSKLQPIIEQSISTAATNIGRGFAQAQRGVEAAQAEYRRERERQAANPQPANRAEQIKQELMAAKNAALQQSASGLVMNQRFQKPAKLKAPAWAMLVMSGMCALCAIPLTLASALMLEPIALVAFAVPSVAFVALAIAGGRSLSLANAFTKYRSLIGSRDHVEVAELALATGTPEKTVVKNLRKMISRSLIKQGGLDQTERTLILTNEAYAHYMQSKSAFEQQQRQAQLAAKATLQTGPVVMTPEATALLAAGEAHIASMRLSNAAIPDPQVSAKIDQIESVVRSILTRVQEHPEAAEELTQLMDYYLPTTTKLLDAYRELEAQPIQGQNIQKSKAEISGALDSLAVAFEKLLDQVFQDVAWDVKSDVQVLKTVLAQEGLTQTPFDMK